MENMSDIFANIIEQTIIRSIFHVIGVNIIEKAGINTTESIGHELEICEQLVAINRGLA
jgi:hypothetical protein